MPPSRESLPASSPWCILPKSPVEWCFGALPARPPASRGLAKTPVAPCRSSSRSCLRSSIGASSKGRASKLHGLRSSALYREIAREFKLSDRELQIMALLAEGYSRTYIRDFYCCSHCKWARRSLHRARTRCGEKYGEDPLKHVYEKCGVSSRQALLDLLEAA